MEPHLAYALKVILCSGILYSFYKLLIEGRTGYTFCRAYIICALVTSAIIPLLKIKVFAGEIIEIAVAPPSPYDFPLVSPEYSGDAAPAGHGMAAGEMIGWIYILGVVLLLARQAVGLSRIGRFTARTQKSVRGSVTIYEGQSIQTPFTFFNKIFIPEGLSRHEREQILVHEASHVRRNHGVELLAMEFIKSWQWFNPFAWMSRRSLEEVHEYQADNDVLMEGYDLDDYKNLLFRQLMGLSPDLSSGLANSKTKKRFIMMEKRKPVPVTILRGLGAIPLLGGLLLLFSFTTKDPVYIFTGQDDDTKKVYIIDETGNRGYFLTIGPDAEGSTYYFVDGKEVTKEEFENLDNDMIASVTVTKDVETVKQYGKDAGSGIILVNLKQAGGDSGLRIISTSEPGQEPGYFIDGKEISAREFKSIDLENIENFTVLTGNKAEELYGMPNGVILVTTKSEFSGKSDKQLPQFLGGYLANFAAWVQRQIALDPRSDGLTGKVVTSFGVDASGKVTDITIRESPSDLMDRIVTEILERSPSWTPAQKDDGSSTASSVGMAFTFGRMEPFTAVDKMPLFKGYDNRAFQEWTTAQIADDPYTKGMAGSVEASYVIDAEGKVTDVNIINSPLIEMGEIVKRILESSDRWTPGTLDGKPVPVKLKTVIHFPVLESLEKTTSESEDGPFVIVEKMPTFEGGDLATFRDWVQQEADRAPRPDGHSGMVVVSFIIDEDGKLVNVERHSAPSDQLYETIKEILESSPRWTPGTQQGKAVPVRYNLPVRFD
ncbi:MAG: energy transducer TonB [Rikenellaceae bacterium]|nr:energy transducer TonB [Rikenellaceae bacterium]